MIFTPSVSPILKVKKEIKPIKPITVIITAEILATNSKFNLDNQDLTIKPTPTMDTKPIRPNHKEVSRKLMAIKTGMKVPEVLIPTITRKNTTITTPIGKSSKPLNKDCSSSGRADKEKGTNSSPAAISMFALRSPASTALTG